MTDSYLRGPQRGTGRPDSTLAFGPAVSEPSRKRDTFRNRYVLALVGLMVAWAAARAYAAWLHPVPYLFPDEYIYVAISRALGHGSLHVRGGLIHFPEVVEPLAASPFWRLFAVPTAFHLVQFENVLAGALSALPIYWMTRWLDLSQRYALACAAFGLALPEMDLVSLTSSDTIGYLAALACIVVALKTLDVPTRRRQLGFLALAVVATLARLEYFALVPAYIVTAIVVDRRRLFRDHSIALLSLVPALGVTALALLGYYKVSLHSIFSQSYVSWLVRQLFLMAVECGVVIVPGAVVALLRPANRRERVFAAFAATFGLLLLLEATKVAIDTSRYTERYVFPILVFVPIGFGLYLRKGRPHGLVVFALAGLIAIGAARMPVSQLVSAVNSEFVEALDSLGGRLSTANVSLLVAILATAGAAGALLVARRGGAVIPLAIAIGVALLISVVATVHDVRGAERVRSVYGRHLDWIDRDATGPVTAIQTPAGNLTNLLFQMYWNPSITREVLLDASVATDSAFAAPKLAVGPTGRLENVPGEFVFYSFATSGQFAGAQKVAQFGPFTLWRPTGRARIRSAVEGRYLDGLLGPFGEIHAWPLRAGDGVQVSFDLAVPASRKQDVRVQIAHSLVTIRPGGNAHVSCASTSGSMRIGFVASDGVIPQQESRVVTARMTHILTTDQPARRGGAATCTVSN